MTLRYAYFVLGIGKKTYVVYKYSDTFFLVDEKDAENFDDSPYLSLSIKDFYTYLRMRGIVDLGINKAPIIKNWELQVKPALPFRKMREETSIYSCKMINAKIIYVDL